MIGIIHYGLGPIGALIAQKVLARPEMKVVGAIDIDPDKVGEDLGLVVGWPHPVGVSIRDDADSVLQSEEAQVVVHAVASSLPRMLPQLRSCLQSGKSVISTCEELVFPWKKYPQIAQELDALAKERGVRILGIGVNPGFVMDLLPIVLSGITAEVESLVVQRTVDLRERRKALQRKMGVGLTLEEFILQEQKGFLKHVGLEESAGMIAHAFGWQIEDYQERVQPIMVGDPTSKGFPEIQSQPLEKEGVEEAVQPIVVEASLLQELPEVKPGQIIGLLQEGIGKMGGKEVLRLTLRMQLGPPDPGDWIKINANPPLEVVFKGIHGDSATAHIVVNAIPCLLKAPAGLLTIKDLPPVSWYQPHIMGP